MNNPLISIIVPIYKVEEYLEECVQSLLKQTYKNLEIILVDDGSPDNCPQMCDYYAQKDKRIKVIHKKNGGLSSARNAGLDIATGEYIGFLDSDDFIAGDMYELLLEGFKQQDNIGIVSSMIYRYEDGKLEEFMPHWNIHTNRIITYDKFSEFVVLTKVNFTCWSKLYRADLLKDVRFRVGRNNEDSYFMFDLSKVLKKKSYNMLEIPHRLYYYRIRENSICTSTKTPLEIDVLLNFSEMIAYYKKYDESLCKKFITYYNERLIGFVIILQKNTNWYNLYYEKYYQELCRIRTIDYILKNKHCLRNCLKFLLLKYTPSICRRILANK
ncbi:MAG: glycosyltransferase [Bacteroidaceae bacterium]|nr:glycosyltransferase [Bacteroidaceae bacterium]